jgi:hypothetical protein
MSMGGGRQADERREPGVCPALEVKALTIR